MKKQNKWNLQTIVLTTIATLVVIFAANSFASAQTTYKVGDRVETMQAGKWIEVKIVEVQNNGQYYVVHNAITDISFGAYATNIRSMKTGGQTNNGNGAGNQNPNPPNGNPRGPKGGGTKAGLQSSAIFKRFGSREPRTCDDTKAPARGAITASLAAKYLNCQMEYVWSTNLYLVENLRVEVGGGVPYTPNLGAFEAIDVRVPLYPIRGSLVRYQCIDLLTEHDGPPDTNCNTYNEPKATGYCYKTTFGDWKCNMVDGAGNNRENVRRKVAPPKP